MIHIKVPIWGTKSIGVAKYKITKDLEVKIDYKDTYGNKVYPETYLMKRDKALSYPTQTVGKGVVLKIIPIEDFEIK